MFLLLHLHFGDIVNQFSLASDLEPIPLVGQTYFLNIFFCVRFKLTTFSAFLGKNIRNTVFCSTERYLHLFFQGKYEDMWWCVLSPHISPTNTWSFECLHVISLLPKLWHFFSITICLVALEKVFQFHFHFLIVLYAIHGHGTF